MLAGSGLAVLLWPGAQVTADIGSVDLAPAMLAPAAAVPAAAVPAAAVPATTAATAATAPGQTALATVGFVPLRLVVPAVGIDAPLLATSVDAHGALVPPEDPADLAWWRGVQPGEGTGSVVVAGHVDARRYGQGPLASLVRLSVGDRAVVHGADGKSTAYTLRGVQTFPKGALPADEMFGHDGEERLVLVTCGGTFDAERGGWDSNVVAVLDPLRTPAAAVTP